MEDVREFEESLKQDRQLFFLDAKRLKSERESLIQTVQELSQSDIALRRLYEQGVVDEVGNPLIFPQMNDDSNHISNE
jgi:hypothetical protein